MKLAVVFPGIGYHCDKPLLYFSKKIAKKYGYEVIEVPYGNFPAGISNKKELIEKALETALAQSEQILFSVDFNSAENIVFISKSIGTITASAYAKKHNLNVHNIFYTPLEETFSYTESSSCNGIAFHGTADPWVADPVIEQCCIKNNVPLFITENGNHSLETGNAQKDISELAVIMKHTENYFASISSAASESLLSEFESKQLPDYEMVSKQLLSLAEISNHYLPLLSNAGALLWSVMKDINWCGFYLMKDGGLVLGPFQGKSACVLIPAGKGVCGTAVLKNEIQLVKDVHLFPGHIACDSASKSEIVLPFHYADGKVAGVLDIDSPSLNRFTESDSKGLKKFIDVLEKVIDYESLSGI